MADETMRTETRDFWPREGSQLFVLFVCLFHHHTRYKKSKIRVQKIYITEKVRKEKTEGKTDVKERQTRKREGKTERRERKEDYMTLCLYIDDFGEKPFEWHS